MRTFLVVPSLIMLTIASGSAEGQAVKGQIPPGVRRQQVPLPGKHEFICRGGGNMESNGYVGMAVLTGNESSTPTLGGVVRFRFAWSAKPAGAQGEDLAPGQCSFSDAGCYSGGPVTCPENFDSHNSGGSKVIPFQINWSRVPLDKYPFVDIQTDVRTIFDNMVGAKATGEYLRCPVVAVNTYEVVDFTACQRFQK